MMQKPLVAFLIWIFLILTGFSAIAQTGPQLNYHGRIVDGITNLGVSGLRNFRIQVRTPAGLADNCLMYEETQSKNLVNGVFVINLNNGSGVRADATAPVYSVQQIFSNKNSFGSFSFAGSRCVSTNPFTYTPGPTDSRRVNIWFEDPVGAPGVWEPLPTQTVAYVPSAIESLNVGGFPIEALLRVVDVSGNPSTLPTPMSEAQYTNLMSLTSGSVVTSINGLAGAPVAITGTSGTDFNITTSGSNINFNIPSSSAANRGLLTAADWSLFNAKMPNTGAAVSAALGYTPLAPANNLSDLSNAATARGNLGLGTSATMSVPGAAAAAASATEVVRGDDPRLTGAIVAGSAASGDLSGTYPNPTVARVGGRTAAQINQSVTDTLAATDVPTASTIVKRDASGNASFVSATATNFSGNNFFVFNAGNANSIQIAAPTPLPSGDYILTLPDTAGTAGYVLSTDGAGNTTWIDPSGTSVTAVNANPPLSSSGGFTPTISISQSNTTTAGYLSSTDWTTFNNKLSTTLSTGQVWVGDGGSIAAPQFLNISNIRSTVAGAWFNAGACAAGEILSYSAVTDQVTCTAMTLTGSQVATALNGIMTGDATITAGGVLTIGNDRITAAMIAPNSVVWSTDVTGKPTTYAGYGITDITLANAGNVNSVEAGLDAARGAFGTLGRVFFATDTREIWYDTGATWLRVGSNAGLGGTVTSVAVNAPLSLTGVATVNPTISLPQATAAIDGYLSSSDFTNFSGKVNRAGDTMTGALNMGSNNITAAGNIAMSANRNIQIGAYAADPACAAPDAGKVWYHTPTGALRYCDGVAVQSIGSLSGVVTGVNGLTGSVNLVLGSAGTDASINTASPNITLNLPTSSAANRGLLSSTDWSNFNSKQAGSTELTGVSALATTGFVQRTGAGTYTTVSSVDLTTSVSGVLPIANGGTNATTANAALNNLLPTQTANANRFLQTNGTNTSWADISSVAVTSVTAAATAGNPIVIAGTTTAPTIDIPRSTAAVNGYLSSTDFTTFNNKQTSSLATDQVWVGSAGGVATAQFLNIGNIKSTVAGNWFNAGACAAGQILSYSAVTDQVTCTAMTLTGAQVATALSGIMSGDATISAAGTLTIGNDKITAAMIAPNSVVWSTDVTGKPTTIAGYGITDAVLINAGGISTMEANLDAARGAFGTVGRVYVSRDTGEIWYDTGAAWVRVGSNAGLGGTVTNVTGTAPISVATGTSTPVVSMTRATIAVDGYLAATDFVLFNSKMSSDFSNATGTLAVANGGTGAATASGARTNLGLGTGDSPSFTGLTVSGVNGNTLVKSSGAGVLSNATSADVTGLLGYTPTSSTLAPNMIFVGNASSVAIGVAMSGDASIVSNGTITLKNTGTAGSYGGASAIPTVTTDAQGRVTGIVTNAYQDATGVTKGILQVGTNLQVAGGTISLQNATAAQTGALTSTDWTTFNNKQGSLGFTPLNPANNLSDVASADVSRTNLGLGTGNSPTFTGLTLSGLANGFVKSTAGVLSGGNTVALSTDVSGILPVANGGTGLSAAGANGNVMYVSGGTFATATPDTAGLVDKTSAQAISGVKTFTANPIIDNAGVVQFREATAGGTNYVGLKAPAALSADVTFTLPAADGTVGQVLRTDGAGNLGWVSGSTGTVTSVTSANTDIGIATTTTTPVLTLNSGLGASQIAKVGAVGISNNTVIVANGAGGLAGQALTDGQLLIGSTGAAPVAAAITGTANRVTVTNGAGTITLSGPQDIHSGASPTFTGLTLSGVTGNTLVRANGSGVLANATSADVTGLLGFTPGAVTTVSGTAPISVATGSSTPVVSITRSTAGVDGYLAATDFVLFNSKMSSDFSNATGTLAIANGGTGAATAGAARTNLGVGTGDSPSFTGLTVSGVTGNTLLRASGTGVVANATSADITTLLGFTPATNVLAANMIFVGNGSNVATAVAMSGDASIVSSGTITLKNTGTAGSYGGASAIPTVTTDAQGRVTGIVTNAYQDATGVTKGILQVGTNLQVAGGTISLQNATNLQTGALTSSDWTMFNAKLSATITAAATGQFIRYDGANWVNATLSSSDLTASLGYTPLNPANNLSDVANAGTSRTNLGLGTGSSPTFTGLTLSGVAGNTLVRANGSGVLANATSADVTGLLGFTPGVGTVTNVTGTAPISVATGTSTPVVSITRSTAGVDGYLAATDFVLFNSKMSSDFSNATGTLAIANGGTGAATAGAARTNLGVGTGDSPSFTGLTVSGVTGNTLLRASGTGVVANATSADITTLLGFTPSSITSIAVGTGMTGGGSSGAVSVGVNAELQGLSGLATLGFIQRTAAGTYSTVSSIDLTTSVTGTLPIANGGTGAVTAGAARTNFGLGTGDSPSFTGLTVSGVNGNTLVKSNGSGVLSNATSADVTTLLGFTPGSVTSVTSANTDIGIATTTTTPVLTLNSGLGASQIAKVGAVGISNNTVIVANGAGGLAGQALTDGQLLIGSTGAAPVAAAITGTANRVTVTNGAGTITLSGPQDIHSGASPTFTGLTVSGVTGNTLLRASGAGVVANATSADITTLLGFTPGVGTVTNVTGTAPISVATGTSTPVVSITRSTAGVDGYLAATDFVLFNSKMSSDFSNATGTLAIANGGTGAATAGAARTNLGVGTGDSPSFTGLTVSGVTGNTLLRASGTGVVANATSADITTLLGFTPATNVLAANMIFVGNGSNVATAVAMSGDASIVSSGTITLKNTGTAGSYGGASAIPTVTTDAQGRVTGIVTNAYQDATGIGKGIVQVGNNISVAAGVISVATADGSTTGVITSGDWTRFDSKLSATIAAAATGQYIRYNGTNWVNSLMVSSDVTTSLGYTPLNPANNLSDVANAGTARTSLGLGTGNSPTFTGLTLSGVTGNTLVRANGSGVLANATSADVTGLLGFTPGVGTVTNVSGTAPISVATGTSTPAISIARSTASVDGYLASTDFTMFNSKMSSDFSNATGTLAIANGGTGAATAAAARTNFGLGTGDSPSFTGLTVSGVNGNTLVKSSGAGVLSNATSADVTGLLGYTPGTITSIAVGTGMTGGGSSGAVSVGVNAELQALSGLATTGFVQRTGAGAYSTQTSIVLSTDVTGALPIANGGTGATTATGALTNLLPAQSTSSVLQSNGTTTSWLTFNTASSNNTLVQRDGSGVLAGYGVSVSGGTSGAVTFTAPGAVTSYSLQLPAAQGAAGTMLQNNGAGVLSWVSSMSADLTTATGTLAVGQGGTGITSGTSGGIPYFNSTSTMASSALLTANGVMLGGGAGASPTTTVAGTSNQVLRIPGAGGAPVFGSIDLSSTAAVTNSLGVANGGTGAATLTAGSLVVGNGTSAVNFLTAGTLGNVIYATGASTWASGTKDTAGLVAQGGNSYAATMTIGTNDANQLNIETNGAVRMSFDTSGAVRVNGQAYSNATTSTTNTGGTVAWDANSSNVMRWTPGTDGAAATAVQISNIKPGGSYQLSVKGTVSGTGQVNIACSTTGAGHVAATYMPANGPRVVTGTLFKTIYTILYDGQDCLVTWISGF